MRALFTGLFDDAALFPPGDASMTAAVPAHRDLRAQLGDLVGPFVVPAARLDELTTHLAEGEGFGISLIASTGDLPAATARVAADPRLSLAAVEVPAVADATAAREALAVLRGALPHAVTAAVELPRTEKRDEVLDVLAVTGVRAKLRTGGLRADLFPTATELAATLTGCTARGIAVKCTAGLHHAVAHLDPATGFAHHGFLNVLLAVDAASAGAQPPVVAEWLRETDADALVAALRTWDAARITRARAAFTSFGTCSVLEPVQDLVRLSLLPIPERIPA